jgi:hypothetical protein
VRLPAVLLIVGPTALSAYAGCRQLQAVPAGPHSPEQIRAVDAIHAYVRRVERAFRLTEDASPEADPGD